MLQIFITYSKTSQDRRSKLANAHWDQGNTEQTAIDTMEQGAVYLDPGTSFEASDIAPPYLRLLQSLSEAVLNNEGTPGEWYLDGVGSHEELDVVVLGVSKYRTYRNEERETMCYSRDAITGVGSPGGMCGPCPHSKWQKDPEMRCSLGFGYLLFVPDYNMMSQLRLERTGTALAKVINTHLATKKPANFVLTLGHRKVNRNNRRYCVGTATLNREREVPDAAHELVPAVGV